MSIIGNPIIVGKKPEQTKTVSPSTAQQIVTPDSGKVLSSVTVNAAPLQAKTVTPNKAGFSVGPDSGQYGLSSVIVHGDSNLVTGNIKSGVTIFGVTGTYNPVTSAIVITGLISTDTVTCSGGGKSYSATWDATAQHWEIVGLPLGTFTITATNGTKTTTETVLIDITGVYEIEMYTTMWLYKDGDKREKLTGGWSSNKAGDATFTEENNCLVAYGGTHSGAYGKFYTCKLIDVSNFSKLKIAIQNCTIAGNVSSFCGLSADTNISADFGYNVKIANQYLGSDGTYEIDISSISGSYYVCFGSGNASRKAYATKIWLE